MSAYLQIRGRLAGKPQERQTKAGNMMATATLAVDLNALDEGTDKTEWFGVTAFGKVGEELRKYSKGDYIGLTGEMRVRDWTNKANTAVRFN